MTVNIHDAKTCNPVAKLVSYIPKSKRVPDKLNGKITYKEHY
ncbi:MAG: hypothetical protein U9R26_02160 [Campylobacterota bacterium]|nr:hypothetical protein [Campylobacterota bacterium]